MHGNLIAGANLIGDFEHPDTLKPRHNYGLHDGEKDGYTPCILYDSLSSLVFTGLEAGHCGAQRTVGDFEITGVMDEARVQTTATPPRQIPTQLRLWKPVWRRR